MRRSVTVNEGLQKYCDKLCSTSGFNQMWLLSLQVYNHYNPIHVNSHITVIKNYSLQVNSTYSISGS